MQKTLLLILCLAPCWLTAQTVDSVALRQVDSLIQVSRALTGKREFDKALEVGTAAEKLALEKFGRMSLTYANCCYRHAVILQNRSNQSSAQEGIKWASESLAIRQELLGDAHVECARSLSILASQYTILRQFEEALIHAQKARVIFEEANQTDDTEYRVTLQRIAIAYSSMGNWEEGEAMFLNLLHYIAQKEGKESLAYAQTLGYLANQSIWSNNYNKSLQYSQEAAAIYEKKGATTEVYYAFCLNTMAQANMHLSRFEEAEKQLLKAMVIAEKAFGKNDSRYASLLSLLSILYNKMKAYDKAIPIIMESLALTGQSMGKESLAYSRVLSNLATAHIELGQLDKAEPLLVEAAAIQERFIAKGNQVIEMQILNNLASVYRMTDRFDLADRLCGKIDALVQSSTIKYINYMSEAELQQSISTVEVRYSAFSLAYSASLQGAIPPDITGTCFDKALFYKGFLQQAAIRARQLAISHPDSQADLDSLRSLQGQLAKMYALSKDQRDLASLANLEANVNDVQKKIARAVAGLGEAARHVNWSDVQKVLAPREAAVELVHFHYYNRSVTFPTDSILYAALVLQPGTNAPKFIPLFEKKQLATLLKTEGKPQPAFYNNLYAAGKTGDQLYDLIWKPIAAALPEGTTVYCSPSGLLHRLNLGAIPTPDGKTLAEKHRLTTVGSTRSLAEGTKAGQLAVPPPVLAAHQNATAQLYGGIQYDVTPVVAANTDTKPDDLAARRGSGPLPASPYWGGENDSTLRGDNWNYLRWTEVEISAAAEVMNGNGIAATLKKGAEATEESFKALGDGGPSPRILHVATHGFFFPDPKSENVRGREGEKVAFDKTFKVSENPMIRSGLVMAGGNHAWKTGKPAQPDLEDGILTAYEISQMNLSNTELAVLSACETGLGDLVGNEGVYGLQRAFKIAGVRYLIMSLWQVPDFQTQVFMSAFYKHWLEGKMAVPEAFRATQAELRAKYGEAFKWAGFVLVE